MLTFEQFQQLPLFEDIKKDDLFFLVPKVSLDFENYQPGEIVFCQDMEPKGLVYLIDGEVKMVSANSESLISKACLLSFSGLFGKDRHFSSKVVAVTACSSLNIDTKSLLFLLRNNSAFLLNYLNVLSDSMSVGKEKE
jgi:CRP-like cAMP-binding protein